MMKKMISLAMAVLMLVAMVACGGGEQTANSFGVVDSTELLQQVWGSYADDEKFAIMGGDYDNNVSDAPGKFNHENAEYCKSKN